MVLLEAVGTALEAMLMPVAFLTAAFSTRPVKPSSSAGTVTTLLCVTTLMMAVVYVLQVGSWTVLPYAAVVFPLVMGVVPTEAALEAWLSDLRAWGLSLAFWGRLHGNVEYAKTYLMAERMLRAVYLRVGWVHTAVSQLLFLVVARRPLAPRMSLLNVVVLHGILRTSAHALQARQWLTLFATLLAAHLLRVISLFSVHTALGAFYLLITSWPWLPGRDSCTVTTVRGVIGSAEFWLPLMGDALPAVLSLLLLVNSLGDMAAWPVACCHWYCNVFLAGLRVVQWTYPPLADRLQQRGRSPRDWSGDCPICWDPMEPYTAQATSCGHVYHASCLRRSITATSRTCPLCRWPVHQALLAA